MSRIHTVERGPADAPTLVLLHGFLGSAANWAQLQHAFGESFHTFAVDLFGHGRTTARPAHFKEAVAALEDWARDRRIGVAHLLGYSMGGRLALSWALSHPERWCSLTLESSSPGLPDEGERAARRAEDDARAARLSAVGLEAFLSEWERLPIFASQQRLSPEVRSRIRALRLQGTGEQAAYALRTFSPGRQPPLWERLHELDMPVHLIGGEYDMKFARTLARMAQRIPKVRLTMVPDAGHTVHLEQPRFYAQAVYDFLDQIENQRRCSNAGTGTKRLVPTRRMA